MIRDDFTVDDCIDAVANALLALDGCQYAMDAGTPFYADRMLASTRALLCGVYRYLRNEDNGGAASDAGEEAKQ